VTISIHDPAAVEQALGVLRAGGVLLVPTETLYGLIADASAPGAAEKIYRLKHRPAVKRLGFFAPSFETLDRDRFTLDERALALARKFSPGPLTLILADRELGTAGIRVSAHPFLNELLPRFGKLIYQTSANHSGMPDAHNVDEALAMLDGDVDLAVDGGQLAPGAQGSTIVDLTTTPGKIVRQGALTIPEAYL